MKKRISMLLSLFVLLLHGCSSDNESKNESTSKKTYLNISNAKSLVVIAKSITKKSTSEETNLYKVLNDGSYVPLNFSDENGSDISVPYVSDIKNLNSEFILLSGNFKIINKDDNVSYNSILVRKSDGAVYNATPIEYSFGSRKLGENLPKIDSEGNIYYYKGYSSVGKLSLKNPDDINVIDYLPTGQTAMFFEVDSKGNCMYQYSESNGNDKYGLRIRKANGGIFEVKVEGQDNREFWLGNDGSFYFVSYIFNNGYFGQINKITIDGDNITSKKIWYQKSENDANVGNMFRSSIQGSYMIKKDKSVVFIDTYHNWGLMNWEFFEDDHSVITINLPKIENDSKIIFSKEYYYIVSKTEIYKVNLKTHVYTTLLKSGSYEIYSITVDDNDKLQFSGLRLDDGKYIFAEISKEGQLKALNTEINKKATTLERIDK